MMMVWIGGRRPRWIPTAPFDTSTTACTVSTLKRLRPAYFGFRCVTQPRE